MIKQGIRQLGEWREEVDRRRLLLGPITLILILKLQAPAFEGKDQEKANQLTAGKIFKAGVWKDALIIESVLPVAGKKEIRILGAQH